MTCPYCNAELDETADRCTTCLKHLPHRDQAYAPVERNNQFAQATQLASNSGVETINPVQATDSAFQVITEELLDPVKFPIPNEPVDPSAKTRILLISVVAGLVIGGIYFAVSRVFDAFLIFPLLVGLLIGGIIGSQITKLKVRNALFALSCGILAGMLGYGLKMVGEAYAMRSDVIASEAPKVASDTGMSLTQATERLEQILNPIRTMSLYFNDYGVTIGSAGSASSATAPEITGPWFWLLLVGECSLVAGFAGVTARTAASAPFCEDCQAWHKTEHLIRKNPKMLKPLIDLARQQNWQAAKELPKGGAITDKANCKVSAVYCPQCKSGFVQVSSTSNNTTNKVFNGRISVQSMDALRKINTVPVAQNAAMA